MVAAICILGLSTTFLSFCVSKFVYGMGFFMSVGLAYLVGAIVVTLAFGMVMAYANRQEPRAASFEGQQS